MNTISEIYWLIDYIGSWIALIGFIGMVIFGAIAVIVDRTAR